MSILAKQMVDFRLIIRTALDPHTPARGRLSTEPYTLLA
jgi:hypothetical protein